MEVYYMPPTPLSTYEVITLCDRETTSATCFPCVACNECLAGKEYFQWSMQKFCLQCFIKQYGQRCFQCHKFITGTTPMSFVYYSNKMWHIECFKCSNCGCFLAGCIENGRCNKCGSKVQI